MLDDLSTRSPRHDSDCFSKDRQRRFLPYSKQAEYLLLRARAIPGTIWVANLTSLILLLNFIALCIIIFVLRGKGADGLRAFDPNDCHADSSLSTDLRYIVNVFATTFLGASNYYMQRLSACSRSEMDSAHRKGSWVDVGVPGMRNMRFMTWERRILWWVFALSSLPVHLLYDHSTNLILTKASILMSCQIQLGRFQNDRCQRVQRSCHIFGGPTIWVASATT